MGGGLRNELFSSNIEIPPAGRNTFRMPTETKDGLTVEGKQEYNRKSQD